MQRNDAPKRPERAPLGSFLKVQLALLIYVFFIFDLVLPTMARAVAGGADPAGWLRALGRPWAGSYALAFAALSALLAYLVRRRGWPMVTVVAIEASTLAVSSVVLGVLLVRALRADWSAIEELARVVSSCSSSSG